MKTKVGIIRTKYENLFKCTWSCRRITGSVIAYGKRKKIIAIYLGKRFFDSGQSAEVGVVKDNRDFVPGTADIQFNMTCIVFYRSGNGRKCVFRSVVIVAAVRDDAKVIAVIGKKWKQTVLKTEKYT